MFNYGAIVPEGGRCHADYLLLEFQFTGQFSNSCRLPKRKKIFTNDQQPSQLLNGCSVTHPFRPKLARNASRYYPQILYPC